MHCERQRRLTECQISEPLQKTNGKFYVYGYLCSFSEEDTREDNVMG